MASITITLGQWLVLMAVIILNHQSVVCGLHRRAIFTHSFQLKRVSNTYNNPSFTSGSLSKRFAVTTDIDVNVFTSPTAELLTTNTTDIEVVNLQSGGEGKVDIKTQASAFDYGILLVCPMLWGTYGPLTRALFSSGEFIHAPPPVMFDTISIFIYSASLSAVNSLRINNNNNNNNELIDTTPSTLSTGITTDSTSPVSTTSSTNNPLTLASIISYFNRLPTDLRGGLELGCWIYFGDLLLLLGLQSTTAIRAAILKQLSTVFVPLFDSWFFSKEPVSGRVFVSCVIALLGVAACSLDEHRLVEGLSFSSGDLLVVMSAALTSFYLVRMGTYSSRAEVFVPSINVTLQCSPLKLMRAMSFTEVMLSIGSLSYVFNVGLDELDNSEEISSWLDAVVHLPGDALWPCPMASGQQWVLLAALWNGAAVTALACIAQSYGQRNVPPTQANLIYATQPFFAALFSYAFLGESIGDTTIAGSSLLFGAVIYSLFTAPPAANTSPH